MRAFILRLLIVPMAAFAFGCSGDINDLPTTPSAVIVTDSFSGTLTKNGAATHPVYTTATGAVTFTLTSLGENPPAKVGLSLGTLSALGTCTVVMHNDNAVVTTSLSGTLTSLAGTLCARIYDVGEVTDPVDYTVTVTHP